MTEAARVVEADPGAGDQDDEVSVDEREDNTSLQALANNGKHASLAVLAVLIETIIVGRDAERALAEFDLPSEGALWVAPRFGWMFSAINVGRKDLGANGEQLQMPVHLEWGETVKVLPADDTYKAEWLTSSMGHAEHASTEVTTSRSLYEAEIEVNEHSIPVCVRLPLESEMELRSRLVTMVEQGKHALWELKTTWEPRVRSLVYKAHASSCIDISNFTGAEMVLLDETAIEAVVDEFMYGAGDDVGKMHRVIEKVLLPQSMQKVDPLRYMNAALRRDAAEAVRQKIGDNRTGRKIRAVAKELDSPDVDAVVAAVRELYPRDKISERRVMAALTIAPDPMAGRWSNHHADGSEVEFEDPS